MQHDNPPRDMTASKGFFGPKMKRKKKRKVHIEGRDTRPMISRDERLAMKATALAAHMASNPPRLLKGVRVKRGS
jgi:hypothetical protein